MAVIERLTPDEFAILNSAHHRVQDAQEYRTMVVEALWVAHQLGPQDTVDHLGVVHRAELPPPA